MILSLLFPGFFLNDLGCHQFGCLGICNGKQSLLSDYGNPFQIRSHLRKSSNLLFIILGSQVHAPCKDHKCQHHPPGKRHNIIYRWQMRQTIQNSLKACGDPFFLFVLVILILVIFFVVLVLVILVVLVFILYFIIFVVLVLILGFVIFVVLVLILGLVIFVVLVLILGLIIFVVLFFIFGFVVFVIFLVLYLVVLVVFVLILGLIIFVVLFFIFGFVIFVIFFVLYLVVLVIFVLILCLIVFVIFLVIIILFFVKVHPLQLGRLVLFMPVLMLPLKEFSHLCKPPI